MTMAWWQQWCQTVLDWDGYNWPLYDEHCTIILFKTIIIQIESWSVNCVMGIIKVSMYGAVYCLVSAIEHEWCVVTGQGSVLSWLALHWCEGLQLTTDWESLLAVEWSAQVSWVRLANTATWPRYKAAISWMSSRRRWGRPRRRWRGTRRSPRTWPGSSKWRSVAVKK